MREYHELKKEYYELKEVKNDISKNLNNIYSYTSKIFDNVMYKTQGIRGTYDYALTELRNVPQTITPLTNNIERLEQILTRKTPKENNTNHESKTDSNNSNGETADNNVPKYDIPKYNIDHINNITIDNTNNSSKIQENKKDIERLRDIINIKNTYFWKDPKDLGEILERDTGIKIQKTENISDIIRCAMKLKSENKEDRYNIIEQKHEQNKTTKAYFSLPRINYDSRIAPQDMKNEFIELYLNSQKNLSQISQDIEQKYGMHISKSTISKHARRYYQNKGMKFKNRKELKSRYILNPKHNN
jgi:hypothetical protein